MVNVLLTYANFSIAILLFFAVDAILFLKEKYLSKSKK